MAHRAAGGLAGSVDAAGVHVIVFLDPIHQPADEDFVVRSTFRGVAGIPHGAEQLVGGHIGYVADAQSMRAGGADQDAAAVVCYLDPAGTARNFVARAAGAVEVKHHRGGFGGVNRIGHQNVPFTVIQVAAVFLEAAGHLRGEFLKAGLIDILAGAQGTIAVAGIPHRGAHEVVVDGGDVLGFVIFLDGSGGEKNLRDRLVVHGFFGGPGSGDIHFVRVCAGIFDVLGAVCALPVLNQLFDFGSLFFGNHEHRQRDVADHFPSFLGRRILQLRQEAFFYAGDADTGDGGKLARVLHGVLHQHVSGVAVGDGIEVGREGDEEGTIAHVVAQGLEVGDFIVDVAPLSAFLSGLGQHGVEHVLIADVLPAGIDEELPGVLAGRHHDEHGGLVVHGVLRDIEFRRAVVAFGNIAVKVVVAVKHLAIVIVVIDHHVLGVRQFLGLHGEGRETGDHHHDGQQQGEILFHGEPPWMIIFSDAAASEENRMIHLSA